VTGVLVTVIAQRAGMMVAGTLSRVNSTDIIDRLDLHMAYLLWGAQSVAAIAGGLAVGFTPRRLGGNAWSALLAASPLCLTIVGIRNELTLSTILWQFVLVVGLAHVGWRTGRLLSRFSRREVAEGP
jgi:hypothetical protein